MAARSIFISRPQIPEDPGDLERRKADQPLAFSDRERHQPGSSSEEPAARQKPLRGLEDAGVSAPAEQVVPLGRQLVEKAVVIDLVGVQHRGNYSR